jgi:putative ABC transport system permease protein
MPQYLLNLLLPALLIVLAVLAGALVLAVALLLLLGVALGGVIALQTVGVLRKVPFTYNVRNLMVRWRATLMTAMAFTVVVGLMTVMLAFVNGMYRLTEASGRPENVIVLADGATDELFSNLGYGDITELGYFNKQVVRDDSGKPLASYEAYMVVNQPIENATADSARKRRFVQVRGLNDAPISGLVHKMALKEGEWFSEVGVQERPSSVGGTAIQAVLGEGIAREFGRDRGLKSLAVGDEFDLGPAKWVVVGIMDSAGSTFDSEVWAKRALAGQKFGKENTITTVVVQTPGAESAKAVADDLTTNYKKPAVQAKVETEYYASLNGTNQQFLYSILFVTVVMAIGGVFGVMNTMFAAISQRTKDIGVLRILGYSRLQVLSSFFLESLLLALLGGLIGCAVGSLCNGWTATSIVGSGQGGGKSVVLKLVVDWRILAAGMGFSLIMGTLGGLIPALSAMRLRALESLR